MKRLFKIWSVMLLVMLIVGLWVPAAPAQALYGSQTWQLQNLPSANSNVMLNGSDVTDMAIGSGVIYVVNGTVYSSTNTSLAPSLTGREVYKSIDGGVSFQTATPVPTSAIASTITGIAVAPDNANVLAVTDGAGVAISSDAGSTWTPLPLSGPWVGGTITDIGVGPARSGTLMGREYFVSVADPGFGTALGDVLLIGGANAAWASVFNPLNPGIASPTYTGVKDYMAVAVTPNFLGDRSVVILGIANAAGGVSNSVVQVVNTALLSTPYQATLTFAGATTTNFVSAANGPLITSAVRGAIALPADFDATTSSGRRAYVGWADFGTATNTQPDTDVYRYDDNIAKALSAGTGVYSLAYAGTLSTGTLFEGRRDSIDIRYSTDMTSGAPTWTSIQKYYQPGAAVPKVIVQVAPDFASTKKVYAGSSDVQSAFSMSTNGGISFDQKAFIDCGVVANNIDALSLVSITSDGKTMFISAKGGGVLSVWKSSTPTSDTSWLRIGVWTPGGAGAGGITMKFPPDYATTTTFYVIDYKKGTTAYNIYRTADGGNTWNTRLAPSTHTATVLQDSNIWYWADENGSLYKSTNGGWTWSSAVSIGLTTPIIQLDVPKADNLIIGGTGGIATSADGGTTFTKIDLNTGEGYRLQKDSGFATNNILYLADSTGNTGKTYKFVLGTDTKPLDLLAPDSNQISSVASISYKSGVLYVMYSGWQPVTSAAANWPLYPTNLSFLNIAGTPGVRVDRTTNPKDTPGTITWSTIDPWALPAATSSSAAYTFAVATDTDTIIYVYFKGSGAGTGASALYAYADQVGTAKPVITAPKDNYSVSINPNSGYGNQFTVTMNAMGSGNGLVTKYEAQITDNATGWPGAETSPVIPVQNPTQPTIVVGGTVWPVQMLSNTVYQLRIRARDEVSGDFIDSPWSTPLTVSVSSGGQVSQSQYGPVLQGPPSTGASLTPGFAWAPIFGATQYKFIVATDAAMTKTVAGTPMTTTLPSFQVTTPLTEGTQYFYSVQAIAPTAGPISVGTFMTAPKAAPSATAAPAPTFTLPPITIPAPIITIPAASAPIITIPAPVPAATPAYVWAIIIIGAILVIAVIVLILRTRRTV